MLKHDETLLHLLEFDKYWYDKEVINCQVLAKLNITYSISCIVDTNYNEI